jgi:hypothetical protein
VFMSSGGGRTNNLAINFSWVGRDCGERGRLWVVSTGGLTVLLRVSKATQLVLISPCSTKA